MACAGSEVRTTQMVREIFRIGITPARFRGGMFHLARDHLFQLEPAPPLR